MPKKIEDLSYEEVMEQITNITNYLDRKDLSLEESIEAFAHGTKLTNHAKKLLNFAEAKIKNVISKERENDWDQRFESDDIFDWV